MQFEEIRRTDNRESGATELAVVVAAPSVKAELDEFYSVVVPHLDISENASWEEIDCAAARLFSADGYREMRRDFVVNRVVGTLLRELKIVPELTPRIRVLEYPDPEADLSFSLSIIEHPKLVLSSYEPVTIDRDEVEVTESLVNNRIAEFLEMRAEYSQAVPHAAHLNDCVSVNIATTCNGKPEPRLTGDKMLLELTHEAMPDAFLRHVVGMEVGDTRSFEYEVVRPRAIADTDVDKYFVMITLLSQMSKTTPNLTDEWVSNNVAKASTVERFRADVAESVKAEIAILNRDTRARLANIELEKRLKGKIPDALYQASCDGLMSKLERELSEKGQTLDDYYEQEHMNEEELSVQILIKSGENLRQGFALEALFDGRGMHVTEEDLKCAFQQAFGSGAFDKGELEKTGKLRIVERAAKRMVALNWLADTAVVRGE